MTAIKSPKPSVSWKSIAGQALFVVVLVLLARYLWIRDRPERLEYPPNASYKISSNNLYATIPGDNLPPDQGIPGHRENTVQVQSIYDSSRRVIGKEDKDVQFYSLSPPNPFLVADGKLYYAVIPRPKVAPRIVGAEGRRAASGRDLINFLPPSKRSPGTGGVGPRRVGIVPAPLPTQEIRFRQVPLQGGASHDVVTLRGENFCLVGNHVFWLQSGSEEQTRGVQGSAQGKEAAPRGCLMLTSLADGVTRRIRSGILRSVTLVPGDSGVSWKEPAPSPGRLAVFYASASDGSVHALGTLAQSDQNPPRYVEFGGRLYWPVVVPVLEGNSNFHSVLMSANLDGADVREVCAQVNKHRIESLWLSVHQGRLYGCLSEAPGETEDRFKSTQYVCRLHPDRSDPIEVVHKLPGTSRQYQFDGDYLYFSYVEPKRGLWATLTNDDTYTPVAEALFRVPLAP